MKSIIAAAILAIIGQPAPVFTAKDVTGKEISLAAQKGKVVVLEWTRFECPFVKKHYKSGNMQRLQEKFTEQDVVWMTISSTAEGKSGYLDDAAFLAKTKMEGSKASYIINDKDGKIGRQYGAKTTPQMFIIDAKGVLVYDGAIDSKPTTDAADIPTAEPLFENALEAVLAGKEVAEAKNKPYGCGVKY